MTKQTPSASASDVMNNIKRRYGVQKKTKRQRLIEDLKSRKYRK